MRHVRRNEERLALTNQVVDDLSLLPGLYDDVAFELVEELLAIHLVEVVAGVRSADDHHEEVPSAVQILISDGRTEVAPVGFDPFQEIQRVAGTTIGLPSVRDVGRVGIGGISVGG